MSMTMRDPWSTFLLIKRWMTETSDSTLEAMVELADVTYKEHFESKKTKEEFAVFVASLIMMLAENLEQSEQKDGAA